MDHAVAGAPALEPDKKRRGHTRHPDRIWINADALNRLTQWTTEVGGRLPGIKLTRSDLANFLVLSHAEALTAGELKELEARYFDPIKVGEWALEELKAAVARGEAVTIEDILATRRPAAASAPRVRKRKSDGPKTNGNTDKTALKQEHLTAKDTLNSVENVTRK